MLLEGAAARAVRLRRATPLGYLPVYVGFIAHKNWKGRGLKIQPRKTWEEWRHASHWAWLNRDDALKTMAEQSRKRA